MEALALQAVVIEQDLEDALTRAVRAEYYASQGGYQNTQGWTQLAEYVE